MILKSKKISKGFILIIFIIIIVTAITAFLWPNIKQLVLGDDYENMVIPITPTKANAKIKEKVFSNFDKLKKYGEWPIISVSENRDRGNPFQEKK